MRKRHAGQRRELNSICYNTQCDAREYISVAGIDLKIYEVRALNEIDAV